MNSKRRIQLALFIRSDHSFGSARRSGGYESYHWAILLSPKNPRENDVNAYDVSDTFIFDPETHENLNPYRQFRLQIKRGITPTRSRSLVGRIDLAKLDDAVSHWDIENIIRRVPIPDKLANPPQSCVTWTRNAIIELRDVGLVRHFDLDNFTKWALRFADRGRPLMGTDEQYKHVAEYGHVQERQIVFDTEPYDDYVDFVYLVTSRTTEEVEEAKGIFPQGYSPFLSSSEEAPLTPDLDVPFGQSVDKKANTAYLRAYKRFGTAGMVAMNRQGEQQKVRIWKVKTTQNMIPENSIGGFWSEEEAFLILGGVHLGQMRGYYEIDVMSERISGRFLDTHRPPHPETDSFHENLLYREDIFAGEQHIRLSELTPKHKLNLRYLLLLPACQTPPLAGSRLSKRTVTDCAWTDTADMGYNGMTGSLDEEEEVEDPVDDGGWKTHDASAGEEDYFSFETGLSRGLRLPVSKEVDDVLNEEMMRLAEKLALEEYVMLINRLGFQTAIMTEDWEKVAKFRARLDGYRALASPKVDKVPSTMTTTTTTTPNVKLFGTTVAITLASLPFYIKDLVSIFNMKMNAWDQVAVVFSIVPLVGCAAQTAADARRGMVLWVPTMLCFGGDALFFTPAALVGLLLRSIGALIETNDRHGMEHVLATYDHGWNEHFDKMKSFLDSKEWFDRMTRQFHNESAEVVLAVAEQRGLLEATKVMLARGNASEREQRQVNQTMDDHYSETLRIMCIKIREKKRWFQMDLPLGVIKWVRDQVHHYNREFISQYRTSMEKEFRKKLRMQTSREGRYPIPQYWKEKQRREFEDKLDHVVHHIRRHGLRHFNESSIAEKVRLHASRIVMPDECGCVTEAHEVDELLDPRLLSPHQSLAEMLDDQLSCAMSETTREDVIVRLLVTGQVDVNEQDDNGNTALTRAAAQGNAAVARAILRSKTAFLNHKNGDGLAAIHLAAGAGHAHIVEMLGNQVWTTSPYRMDMNIRNTRGETALMLAAENMDEEVVKKLMLTGYVQTDLVNDRNQSALDIAQRKGYERIVKLIREKSAYYVSEPPPELDVFPWTWEVPTFWPRRAVRVVEEEAGGVDVYVLNTGERWRNDTGQFWDEERKGWFVKEGVDRPDLSLPRPGSGDGGGGGGG
ncbi:hypothetical protein CP532_6182 [Ophiocordyceps camponoti-leonardi (nom. inval.)]|nr:hypothetical protein CP532_6182 [Ophiocordyceps camponoti-leonardi (nom. inval.)]